ncbi:hypothetical protein V1J52_15565 [Streptomyces sp. TRM 70351]|nr:hypothetical protein [Streptomyces sp. TRM 70351]MEE1929586.1 hypothetical protein [Streptomyces sp. TRM 70351]
MIPSVSANPSERHHARAAVRHYEDAVFLHDGRRLPCVTQWATLLDSSLR